MTSLKLLKSTPPQSERQTRRESRCSVTLPLRLITGSGETIPAVILNVSASGLLVLVDERSSLVLPPPRGSFLDGEFFFEEVEVPQITLEIVRVEQRNHRQLALGCKFVDSSSDVIAAIRAKVTARLSGSTIHKSR